jgi:hypothetical protein
MASGSDELPAYESRKFPGMRSPPGKPTGFDVDNPVRIFRFCLSAPELGSGTQVPLESAVPESAGSAPCLTLGTERPVCTPGAQKSTDTQGISLLAVAVTGLTPVFL